jgi:hypothetical protein
MKPNSFMVNVLNNKNYLLNYTTTCAPVFDEKNGYIYIHLDGRFYDRIQRTSHVSPNIVTPPRYQNSHSN